MEEKKAAIAGKEIVVRNGATTGALAAEPRLLLGKARLLLVALFGLGGVVAFMQIFVHGVTIEKGIVDAVGSSDNADNKVQKYQTINGYLMTFLDTIREGYFDIFLPVMLTFLANARWFPGDRPTEGTGRLKSLVLFWILPVLGYILGVGFSSLYIGHKVVGLRRVFLDGDLKNVLPKRSIVTDVEDTILRTGVRRKVEPFEILTSSTCVKPNESTASTSELAQLLGQNDPVLPTVHELDTTAVVYGFPLQDWNYEVIPRKLKPKYALNISMKEYNATPAKFEVQFKAFQKATNLSYVTAYEIFLQGKMLMERAISDSVNYDYPCSEVDGQTSLDTGGGAAGTGSGANRRRLKAQAASDTNDATSQGNEPAASGPGAQSNKADASDANAPGNEEGGSDQWGGWGSNWFTGSDWFSFGSNGWAFSDMTSQGMDPGTVFEGEDGGTTSGTDTMFGSTGGSEPTFTDETGMVYDADGNVVGYAGASFNFDQYADEPVKWEYYDDGRRKCRGAPSTLPQLKDMYNKSANVYNLPSFLNLTSKAFDFFPNVTREEIQYRFEHYEISPMINVTSITIDFPVGLSENYNMLDDDFCEMKAADLPKEITVAIQEKLCDPKNYVYTRQNAMCGSTSCVFIDKNNSIPITRQLLLLPTLSNCNVSAMKYDTDLSNYFPTQCTPHNDSVFLYGFGTYVTGDSFTSGVKENFYPQILKPRRHGVFTVAKLQWELKDLAGIFGARCTAKPNCDGLAHFLAPSSRFLVMGQKFIPMERMSRDFRDPVQLVTLNTKPFYYPDLQEYYEWEHLSMDRFNNTSWGAKEALSGTKCSMLVDSYIAQIDNNIFFLEEPLQPLYTSALYYLFQDAAVKTMNNSVYFAGKNLQSRNTTGLMLTTLRLLGDQEVKQVGFSISKESAIATFVGLGTMVLLTTLLLGSHNVSRVRLPNEPEAVVEKIVEVLTEEDYPETVHKRKLVFAKSQQQVDLDEFTVESIQLEQQKGRHSRIQL